MTVEMKSSCEYVNGKRVFLERNWNSKLPHITIIMNCPSTADALTNDRTINACIKIAEYNNYGGIKVYNIDDLFKQTIQDKSIIIAWGMKVNKKKSINIINKLSLSHKLLCFTQLKDGTPGLPTRLNNETNIKPFIIK
jgi:hypothetical protein